MRREIINKRTILSLFLLISVFIGVFTLLNRDKFAIVVEQKWDKGINLMLRKWVNVFHKDELIELEGYSLSIRDYGKGEPTVIIDPGLNCSKEAYNKLQFLTSFNYRVISYDHAGNFKSTSNSNPRTLPYYVKELKAMLKSKNISPPYILVGHSLGGLIIRYYTYLYPDEVAGLIFLDSPHEDWFRYIRSEWSIEDQKEYFRFWDPKYNTNYKGTAAQELLEYEANCDSIRGKEIPKNIPVLMFTGKNTYHFRKDSIGLEQDAKKWSELQKSLIKNHPYAKQIIDLETGHWPQDDKPLFVQREINKFIKKYSEREITKNSSN